MNNEVKNYSGCRETPKNKEQKKGWRKVSERVGRWMGNTDKNTWLKDMRGNLILVSTVIATMTFQMALNPPGGVRPIKDQYDNGPEGRKLIPCTIGGKDLELCPGEAVMALIRPDEYIVFLFANTICLIGSLCICLLLVSGIPLHLRFPVWLLSIGMGVTLTSLALSYITAVQMTAPEPIIFDTASKFLENLVYTWIGLLALIILWHTLLLVLWGVQFFHKRNKKAITQKIPDEIPGLLVFSVPGLEPSILRLKNDSSTKRPLEKHAVNLIVF